YQSSALSQTYFLLCVLLNESNFVFVVKPTKIIVLKTTDQILRSLMNMNSFPQLGETVLNYIDGKWEASESDRFTDRFDPADNSFLAGRPPDSTGKDARRAVEAAAAAQETWRSWNAPKRGRLLFDWLNWMDKHKEELAYLLTREEGKILAESA